MICVFDSGVWISAFHFGGTPLAALNRAFNQDQIAICEPILYEIGAALTGKFGWSRADIDGVLREYLADAVRVRVPGELRGVCRDPKDNMVFECAVRAGASVIISGDKDLLTVVRYKDIQVLTPRGYLEMSL